jgi:hypothetical protein
MSQHNGDEFNRNFTCAKIVIQASLQIDRPNLLPADTERYLPLAVKTHVLTAAIVSGALSRRKSQASVAVTDTHSRSLFSPSTIQFAPNEMQHRAPVYAPEGFVRYVVYL